MKKPQVAIIYSRVSTLRQASEGVSLEAQETKARAHAARLELPVVDVFRDEGLSGKMEATRRPGLKALLDRVQALRAQGTEPVVIVYSVSRLARRQRLLWNLLEDMSISSATEQFENATPMGKAMLGMIAVFAQLEADMVSERTKDALNELKSQGKKLGRPHLVTPELLAKVRELRSLGLSAPRICLALMEQGIPTPAGSKKWHKTQVLRIFSMLDEKS